MMSISLRHDLFRYIRRLCTGCTATPCIVRLNPGEEEFRGSNKSMNFLGEPVRIRDILCIYFLSSHARGLSS
jgi:hypothetical protein